MARSKWNILDREFWHSARSLLIIIPVVIGLVWLSNYAQEICEETPDPPPPYGIPDDRSFYEDGEGYRSVTYDYDCYRGNYVSITYIRPSKCADFEMDSRYTSEGRCD